MTSTEPVRPTRQRLLIREALESFTEFRSASEVHAHLAASGTPVGLATVYRTLQLFADSGEVDAVMTPDGESAYRICSDRHHHHMVCRDCGATVEVTGPGVERFVKAIADEHGYADVSHSFELVGRCPRCQPAR